MLFFRRLPISAVAIFLIMGPLGSIGVLAQTNDPLFPQQWHLHNTGQLGGVADADINIGNVWRSFRGKKSVPIAILGDGLESTHEDLAANVVVENNYNFVADNTDASHATGEFLGTRMAGVAAAVMGNGVGGVGVAPGAGLIAYRIAADVGNSTLARALTHAPENWATMLYATTDASAALDVTAPSRLDLNLEAALRYGVEVPRNGKGNVYVFSAGDNVGTNYALTSYNGLLNSPYVIVVSGHDNFEQTVWGRRGPTITVNAPARGTVLPIATTDVGNTYTTDYSGTSSAAAGVAGVVAMMLQVNKRLSWLDVRHLLIHTADSNRESSFANNGAGLPYSRALGFGKVNAQAAVRGALRYASIGQRQLIVVDDLFDGASRTLWDAYDHDGDPLTFPLTTPTTVTQDFSLTSTGGARTNMLVEFADLVVDIPATELISPNWGEYDISITSPSGTTSYVALEHPEGSGQLRDYIFGSLRFYNEPLIVGGNGVWSVTITDQVGSNDNPNDGATFVDFIKLRFYGHQDADSDEMPDDWENHFFGSTTLTNDKNADTDTDGVSNLTEFRNGTDPYVTTLAVYDAVMETKRVGVPGGGITAFAASGGETTVTSVDHRLVTGDTVVITGTTSYNGTYVINDVTPNTFDVATVFVADDATGNWRQVPLGINRLTKTGRVFVSVESGEVRAIFTVRHGSTVLGFAEEDWTAGSVFEFSANGTKRLRDVRAFYTTGSSRFTSFLLKGRQRNKVELGVTAIRSLGTDLNGTICHSDFVYRYYEASSIRMTLHEPRSQRANNARQTLQQAVDQYKTKLGF